MKKDKLLWKIDSKDVIPANVMDVKSIVPYSNPTNLTEQQQNNIIAAFNSHAYDMAAEYVWKKAITITLQLHQLVLQQVLVLPL